MSSENYSETKDLEPTRTVIIAGFQSNEELEEYKSTVFNPEKMVEYYTIPQTRIIFMIFYNISESINFYNNFRSDYLRINYTISKYELPKKNEVCTEKSLQGTVSITFKNIDSKVEDDFVKNFLKQYGEIMSVRSEAQVNQKIIQFFDIRDAQKMFNTMNMSPFGTGELQCAWMWDMSVSTRVNYIKLADEFIWSQVDGLVKRVKIEKNSKKNIFVDLFDKFIAKNVLDIERMYR
ncbi:hypothetical protein GINT2_001546 [Glugoides intestinalis]